MFNEWNQIHNLISSSGSGTVINYGSGSDFLTSYGSGYGSGSTSQKVTVPSVPVPVPQHCSCRYALCWFKPDWYTLYHPDPGSGSGIAEFFPESRISDSKNFLDKKYLYFLSIGSHFFVPVQILEKKSLSRIRDKHPGSATLDPDIRTSNCKWAPRACLLMHKTLSSRYRREMLFLIHLALKIPDTSDPHHYR